MIRMSSASPPHNAVICMARRGGVAGSASPDSDGTGGCGQPQIAGRRGLAAFI